MAQGSFKKSGGAPKMKGKAGRGNVAAKSRRLVNKGKTAVKKGCECRVWVSCCCLCWLCHDQMLLGSRWLPRLASLKFTSAQQSKWRGPTTETTSVHLVGQHQLLQSTLLQYCCCTGPGHLRNALRVGNIHWLGFSGPSETPGLSISDDMVLKLAQEAASYDT